MKDGGRSPKFFCQTFVGLQQVGRMSGPGHWPYWPADRGPAPHFIAVRRWRAPDRTEGGRPGAQGPSGSRRYRGGIAQRGE
jgi:hypothetical protein